MIYHIFIIMSNILQYNALENSNDSRKNCNSPVTTDRHINNKKYTFMPIYTSESENGSEKSPLNNRFLDSHFYMRYFFNFKKNSVVSAFMLIYISVYLASQVLQSSPVISTNSHNIITSSSFSYNLLFSTLISYFIFTYSNILAKQLTMKNMLVYWFFCTAGALGFAMLGEVPFLKNISITKGWLHNLSPWAYVVIICFSMIIIGAAIKEYITKIAFGDRCRSFTKILMISLFYYGVLFILKSSNAVDIHYHVHHAICAGLLSFWFIDWHYYYELIIHSILMGVVIEGIDFYGIQELFLFLSKNNSVNLEVVGFIYGGFTLFMFLAIWVLKKFYFD